MQETMTDKGNCIFSCNSQISSIQCTYNSNGRFFNQIIAVVSFFGLENIGCGYLMEASQFIKYLQHLCFYRELILLARDNFCHLLITFVNSLDPDQNQQNVGPDLVPVFCRGRDPARILRKFQQSCGRNTLVVNLVAAEFSQNSQSKLSVLLF